MVKQGEVERLDESGPLGEVAVANRLGNDPGTMLKNSLAKQGEAGSGPDQKGLLSLTLAAT